MPAPIRITYTYTRPGKETGEYDHWVVVDRPDLKVLFMDEYRGDAISLLGKTVLEPGGAIVWYVFPDRWHDIGLFHREDGTFTGWYTNLCTPPAIDGVEWAATDLFLDHWTARNGAMTWLDEDELADAIDGGVLDPATVKRIATERVYIEERIRADDWPPRVTAEVDLETARRLVG